MYLAWPSGENESKADYNERIQMLSDKGDDWRSNPPPVPSPEMRHGNVRVPDNAQSEEMHAVPDEAAPETKPILVNQHDEDRDPLDLAISKMHEQDAVDSNTESTERRLNPPPVDAND